MMPAAHADLGVPIVDYAVIDDCTLKVVGYHTSSPADSYDVVYYTNLGTYAASTSSLLGNNSVSQGCYGQQPVLASRQVPIIMESSQLTAPSYYMITGGIVLGYNEQQADDRGAAVPTLQRDSMMPFPRKSVGDIVEPITRYIREWNDITTRLHERRGTDAQERFMFEIVAPFVEKHGIEALHDIDRTLSTLTRSARYCFPYLLGHLEPKDVRLARACRELLNKYADSPDSDIREGALEALDHLNAA